MHPIVRGLKYLLDAIHGGHMIQIKAIFNDRGIVFAPVSIEHKDMDSQDIKYSLQAGRGNALAAMLYDRLDYGRVIEIRGDDRLPESRVKRIMGDLTSVDALADSLQGFFVLYKGKSLGKFEKM